MKDGVALLTARSVPGYVQQNEYGAIMGKRVAVWKLLACTLLVAMGSARASDCDLDAGAQIFQRCVACHSLTKHEHAVGPSLYAILGQAAGKQKGFLFSAALTESEIVWSEESLSAFLESPMSFIPGSVMPFAGIKKSEDRATLICWLSAQVKD